MAPDSLPAMTDPIVAAARRAIAEAVVVLRGAVTGLDHSALDRRPAGPDTNSLAVLSTHALNATRFLVSLAVGAPLPDRNRPAEFATSAVDTDLPALIERLAADTLSVLDDAGSVEWGAVRTFTRGDGSRAEMTAAYALIHAVDHLRGHADEAALTRHLVEPG